MQKSHKSIDRAKNAFQMHQVGSGTTLGISVDRLRVRRKSDLDSEELSEALACKSSAGRVKQRSVRTRSATSDSRQLTSLVGSAPHQQLQTVTEEEEVQQRAHSDGKASQMRRARSGSTSPLTRSRSLRRAASSGNTSPRNTGVVSSVAQTLSLRKSGERSDHHKKNVLVQVLRDPLQRTSNCDLFVIPLKMITDEHRLILRSAHGLDTDSDADTKLKRRAAHLFYQEKRYLDFGGQAWRQQPGLFAPYRRRSSYGPVPPCQEFYSFAVPM